MDSRSGFGQPFLESTATCMSTLVSVYYNFIMDQGMWSWHVVSVHGASTTCVSGMLLNPEDPEKEEDVVLIFMHSWCSGENRHKPITVIQDNVSPNGSIQRVVGGVQSTNLKALSHSSKIQWFRSDFSHWWYNAVFCFRDI